MTTTTSPNLSTNKTVYASCVCTFVVHFLSISMQTCNEGLVCFPISCVFFLLKFTLLLSSFRTWFIYIFFSEMVYGKKMCGPQVQKTAAMLVFLKLIECIFVESSALPSGTKTGKTFFNDKCRTL